MRKILTAVFLGALLISLAGQLQASGLLQIVNGKPQAPDFSLPDLDGEKHSLARYRGKVIIVNFWATWCPPCRKEMPSMQRAFKALEGSDVIMLAVHVGGNEDKIWTFLNDIDVTFPVLIDAGGKIGRKWPMRGLPTTFIIDGQGRIALRAIGGREWDDPAILKHILSLRD